MLTPVSRVVGHRVGAGIARRRTMIRRRGCSGEDQPATCGIVMAGPRHGGEHRAAEDVELCLGIDLMEVHPTVAG